MLARNRASAASPSVSTNFQVPLRKGASRATLAASSAAGCPDTEKLSEVLLQLNEASLSQLRDHETGHLEHKIANVLK